jgi:hypothetical protein
MCYDIVEMMIKFYDDQHFCFFQTHTPWRATLREACAAGLNFTTTILTGRDTEGPQAPFKLGRLATTPPASMDVSVSIYLPASASWPYFSIWLQWNLWTTGL